MGGGKSLTAGGKTWFQQAQIQTLGLEHCLCRENPIWMENISGIMQDWNSQQAGVEAEESQTVAWSAEVAHIWH